MADPVSGKGCPLPECDRRIPCRPPAPTCPMYGDNPQPPPGLGAATPARHNVHVTLHRCRVCNQEVSDMPGDPRHDGGAHDISGANTPPRPQDCEHLKVRTLRSHPPRSECLSCGAVVAQKWVLAEEAGHE